MQNFFKKINKNDKIVHTTIRHKYMPNKKLTCPPKINK